VELSISSPIRQISASKYHTIALNAAGECFVWGFGKGGRLGTGTEFEYVSFHALQGR
jgi:alpha-tubulin suppressor-like RCC1 family protein